MVARRDSVSPDGEGPDSLVRRIGADAFAQEIPRAQPLSTFLFDKLARPGGHAEPGRSRARLGELAKPLLERLPSGLFRDMMEQSLRKGRTENPTAEIRPAQRPSRPRVARPGQHSALRRARSLLVQVSRSSPNRDLPDGWRARLTGDPDASSCSQRC